MTSYNHQATLFVLNNYVSVQVAGKYSGYSLQYLRRLLRNGKLGGIKIGQLWLTNQESAEGSVPSFELIETAAILFLLDVVLHD